MLQLLIRPGMLVEVGANVGAHTVALAREGANQGRQLAVFEPQPFIFQNLCANLALNGITNVRAWPFACGETERTIYFQRQDYLQTGNFGGVEMQEQADGDSIAVPCIKLDDVLDGASVGLIKIDVEGFELLVLQGAEQIIAQSRPVLYVENDRVESSPALIQWLMDKDYRLWWHTPNLFNPDNFFGKEENIYGHVMSFNMLALPKEIDIAVNGLLEITDAESHILANKNGE
ncbi:FkbM family methyltransferase [Paraburkholderia hayleyella]|uniref:FkbM family methyltransferase n=1 Tax=Paraburkholderia hayleyella TaxID=2152889 RepID=UPI001C660850|nr:FkbM family methyltransferase [Paraburkholderia hayleyella]